MQKKSKIDGIFWIGLVAIWGLVFVTGCMDSDMETIHPPNCQGTFALPKPVELKPAMGQRQYHAKYDTVEFFVDVYDPHAAKHPEGTPPADILRTMEEKALYTGSNPMVPRLKTKLGVEPQVTFEKDLKTDRAIGQQIRVQAGDQFVLTRFYVAPDALYYFKIDNGDENNEMVARVYDSINP